MVQGRRNIQCEGTHSVANSEGANSGLKLLVVQLPICRHHCSCCKPRTNATLTTTAAAAADGDTAPNVTPSLAFKHYFFSADAGAAAASLGLTPL